MIIVLLAFISAVVFAVIIHLLGDPTQGGEVPEEEKEYRMAISLFVIPIISFGYFGLLYVGIIKGIPGLTVLCLIIGAIVTAVYFISTEPADSYTSVQVTEKQRSQKRQEELLMMARSNSREDKHRFDELYGRPLCRNDTPYGTKLRWAHQAVMRIAKNEGWIYEKPSLGLGYYDEPSEYKEEKYTKWYQECKFPKWARVHYPEEFENEYQYNQYAYKGIDPDREPFKNLSNARERALDKLYTDTWHETYNIWLAHDIDVCDPEEVSKYPNARAMSEARETNRKILEQRYPSYKERRWNGITYEECGIRDEMRIKAYIVTKIKQIEKRAAVRSKQDPSLTTKQVFESLIVDEIYEVFVLGRDEYVRSTTFGSTEYSCDEEELVAKVTSNIRLYGECYAASCEGDSMWAPFDELAASKEAREVACRHLEHPLSEDAILWFSWRWYQETERTPVKGLAKQIQRLREKAKAQEEEWQRAREED